jgi:hypothetical protein
MAEEAAPLEFRDRQSLEAWLRTQPREVSVTIAARAALRVLPLWARNSFDKTDWRDLRDFGECTGSLFRATALAQVAARYPFRAKKLHKDISAGRSAAFRTSTRYYPQSRDNEAARAAAEAAAYAARASLSEVGVPGAAQAAFAADYASRTQAPDIYAATSADANFLRNETSARHLAEQPLWPRGETPAWVASSWRLLRDLLPKDQDWDVWLDWYDARLKGGPVPEAIELVYATVPPEKWDEGPAAANAWIKEQLQLLREETKEEEAFEALEFRDFESFEVWLRTQPREVAVILTARTALRLLPQFPGYVQTKQLNQRQISEAAAPLFRALALARVAAKYPARIQELGPATYAAAGAIKTDNDANAAAGAAYAAAIAVADEGRTGSAARSLAMRASNDNDKSHWAALSADASFLKSAERSSLTLVTLAERPLWPPSAGVTGTTNSWLKLFDTLPHHEAWDVWIEWFKAGLAGGPVPEEIERVYAAVPQAKWEEGPAAANAWIKAELARLRDERTREDTPAILSPPAIPPQIPGPHVEIDVETGVIVPAKPESLDAEGNNLSRLKAHHPLILRLADELLGKIGQNEQPELFGAVKSYFENVNRDLAEIDFERLWGEGVYLEEAAAAAERGIQDAMREPLSDAALSALQALLRIHGPFILATRAGLENLAFANAYEMRPEEREEQRRAVIEFAKALAKNPQLVSPETAQMVTHFAAQPDSTVHPERSAAFKAGLTRNVVIVVTAAASIGGIIATLGFTTGLPVAGVLALPLIEGYKKSEPFLKVAGLVTHGLNTLSKTDAREAWEKLNNVSFERYREFVLENEELLRRLAGSRKEMRWLHEHLDWLIQTDIQKD